MIDFNYCLKFFFFKQKTAYEMRISDWSSDVCSSDLDRYEMADEFVDVAEALWSAWDRDALVRDTANNVYIDPAKVREINHRGKYFKVRGPLNQVPSPQGKPVLKNGRASCRERVCQDV